MKPKTLIITIVSVIAVGVGYAFYWKSATAGTKTPSVQGASTTSADTTTKTKFSDTADYQNAYVISDDTLTAQAQTALTGFALSKTTNPDGSTVFTLKAKQANYQDQTYTVQSGQKLYFIETSLGDDNGDADTNLRDDTAVVVDADGYIVS